jgi:hypothetical protein
MGHLTIQERFLIVFVLGAVLLGTIVKFWRDRAAVKEESPSGEKIAHESVAEQE